MGEDGDKVPQKEFVAMRDPVQKKRLLWCSQHDWQTAETIDYYADTLTMLKMDDGKFALELNCGGHVVRLPIKATDGYLI